jgi:hypothetical protein
MLVIRLGLDDRQNVTYQGERRQWQKFPEISHRRIFFAAAPPAQRGLPVHLRERPPLRSILMRKGNAMVFVKGGYSVPPDDTEFPVDPIIIKIRRYQAEIDRLNAPPVPATPEAEAVGDAPAVEPRKPSELQRAKDFLVATLTGETPAEEVKRLAAEQNISARTLRRAVRALRVRNRKEGRHRSFWSPLNSGQGARVAS